MTTLSDEELIAYVDGELTLAQRRDVERRLKQDPEAQALVKRLSETSAMMRETYEPAMTEPLPVALMESVSAAMANIPPPPAPSQSNSAGTNPGWGFAIAASFLALVVGGVGGMGTLLAIDSRDNAPNDAYVGIFEANAERALMEMLETKPSGTRVAWHDPRAEAMAEFTIIKTYRREDGTFCREFLRAVNIGGVEKRTRDLACRQGAKKWTTEVRMADDGSLSF